MKLIIIKYAELNTKKGNINFFLTSLKNNIKANLKDIKHKLTYDKGRMYLETEDYESAIKVLTNTFGIHEVSIAHEYDDMDINNLGKELTILLKDEEFSTIKVSTKRANKEYPLTSMEISKELGGIILKNMKDKKVDVHHPDLEINVEIRNTKAYIYFDKIKGIGGFPVGTLGKGMLMLSGGIDSPVAGYLAMKRGIRLEAIYFESPPHTSDNAKNKVLTLARELSKYSEYLKLHIINFTNIQEAIYKNCPRDYMITLLRRMMYRISERIAYHHNCKVLINGESVGQVASQTLTSMSVINEVVKMPVLRPLACFDKSEIINIARKINTYETSILPYEDCCTIFVPDHPVINPESYKAQEYEKLIPFEELISEAIKTKEVIKIEPINKEYDNIL